MMHQRHKSQSRKKGINISHNNKESYRDDKKDKNTSKDKDKLAITRREDVYVNDAKLGALLYFPIIGIVLTSCLGNMYHRNSTMHREPITAHALLVDCPVKDPDHVWLLLVCCYLVVVVSIVVLCHTMLGFRFSLVATAKSTRMRVTTCRICLLLFYCGFYNWDICMGNMPYLKKATTQVYFTCVVLFISSPTLSMPVIIKNSKSYSSKPPRWPIFLIKLMVFILYADAGWHKLHFGFSGNTLRAFLVHHWTYYERPMALFLLDYPMLISVSAHATLIFECAGWILVCFDCDRVAAVVGISFHIGIYLAMKIDFITFWCCSFVFFFVPSIISSSMFQRLLKRQDGEQSLLVPLGCSPFVGIEGGSKDAASTVIGSVISGGDNSKSKRKRKASVLFGVSCVVILTYKGFYPRTMMLPTMPQSRSHSFVSLLYGQLSGMTFKPFNTYTMYSKASFPMRCSAAFLVLKRRTPLLNTTEHKRRVKWIPNRASDFYLYSNILKELNIRNRYQTITLNSGRDLTRCNIFACLARHYIFSDLAGNWTKDGAQETRHGVKIDNLWDIDSIELVEEEYNELTTVDDDFGESFPGSLQKLKTTSCGLDNTDRELDDDEGIQRDFDFYDYESCADKLAELDASGRSINASSNENPFYIIPGKSRTDKPYVDKPEFALEAPTGAVVVVMLIVGYKTYLLAR